jgi:hypothetical protein
VEPEPTVSQSVEVPVGPGATFELYTAGIDRWCKRDSWYWNDRLYGEGAKELLGWFADAAGAG